MKRKFTRVAVLLLLASITCQSALAQYTKLLDFAGATNGETPYYSELYSDGSFMYGMTYSGGTYGLGTIFKIKSDGTGYVKLLDFAGAANGSNPYGSLISDGTFLYGMTSGGGAFGWGTIFKIKPDGTGYVKLLDFGGASNGSNPYGSLIFDGTFMYGMTYRGGLNNLGTVFKIKPDGTGYVKLLNFGSNGSNPYGSLVSDGTFLYGMTYYGGTNNMGTVFKIKLDGTSYIKLLDFMGAANGSYSLGSLIFDGTFLFGMTYHGGSNSMGTVFKVKSDGTGYIKLLDFAGAVNGRNPYGSLISIGTFLYGMTYFGGTNGEGTIFKIMPDGANYVKLLDFAGAANGRFPYGSLISDETFLYGMTSGGGTNNKGVVFKYEYCPASASAVSVTACETYTVPSGDETYTTSGTYMDTIPNAAGCDSTITLNLTINSTATPTITQSGSDLISNAAAGNQWLDSTGATITGAVNQTFTPSVEGTYYVLVTENGCVSDTSAGFNFVFPLSPPAAPTNLTIVAAKTNDGKLHLSWQDNSNNEDGFIIERSMDSASWITADSGAIDATGYLDTLLMDSTQYFYRIYAYNSAGNSSFSNTAGGTTFASSLKESSGKNSYVIYPNPNNGTFTLSSDSYLEATITVTDLTGRAIYEERAAGNNLSINLSDKGRGIYYLKVTGENHVNTFKIVVQ